MSIFAPNAIATIQVTDDLLFSAFGATSMTQSDNETPIFLNREISDETCFDCDTNLGLQFDYQLYTNLTSSIQIVKRPQDEWSEPVIEWLYAGYNHEQYDLKVGRLRLPTFLDSEYYYVTQAYSSVRPPQEVYDSLLGVTSYDGISLKWQGELNDELSLSIEPYGTLWGDRKATKGNEEYTFDINHLIGLKIELSSYDYRLYLNGLSTNFDMEVNYPKIGVTIMQPDTPLNMLSFGGEYTWETMTLRGEAYYSEDNFNWYAQVSYNLNKLTPYASYAQKNNHGGSTVVSENQSITTGLRFDFTPTISVNLEYQHVITGDYSPSALSGRGQFTKPFTSNEIDANIVTLMLNFIL